MVRYGMTLSSSIHPSQAHLATRLQQQLKSTLGPFIPPGSTVALLDFPNHDNIGDSLIWLGTIAYLRSLGCDIAYTCDRTSYSARRATRAIGRGSPVLLHGGGNFGDLWPTFQMFREQVIADLQDHPIVQLPQSVFFRQPGALRRCAQLLDRHPQLVITVRDRVSFGTVSTNFKAHAALCPDMAFALWPLSPVHARVTPEYDVVWLSRTDAERHHGSDPSAGSNVLIVDWSPDPRHMRALRLANKILGKGLSLVDYDLHQLETLLNNIFLVHARERRTEGIETLSRGHVVVTDRLHGHILCLLLDIPHVLLDNSYGKLRLFYDAWTHESDITRWASSPSDALRQALAWAESLDTLDGAQQS